MPEADFYISRVKVHNFKNFKDLDVELGKFNVIIGQNASGKSNFRKIFSFLKDIFDAGLANAISFQGGGDHIKNFTTRDTVLSMEVHFAADGVAMPYITRSPNTRNKFICTGNMIYKFSIKFLKSKYIITDDQLSIPCSFKKSPKSQKIPGKIIMSKKGEHVNIKLDFPDSANILKNSMLPFLYGNFDSNHLLLESDITTKFLIPGWYHFFSNMGLHDFEPKRLKAPSKMRSSLKLNYTGANLSVILHNLQHDSKKLKTLENYMWNLLPFFKSISTEPIAGEYLKFNLQETYNSKLLPGVFVSDGTVNILAMLICLFLQDNKFTAIEEPERNIHPGLLSQIIQLMDESSELNQILITTHNPDTLNYVQKENILILTRDQKGNSTIIKPRDHEIVKKFQNIMSMGQLMNQNMLD